MPKTSDLQEYADYHHLSEQLVADATKNELVECARLLALQVAHYHAQYGESLLEQEILAATTNDPDTATSKLLSDGAQTFVGVLAMLKGYEVETGNLTH